MKDLSGVDAVKLRVGQGEQLAYEIAERFWRAVIVRVGDDDDRISGRL